MFKQRIGSFVWFWSDVYWYVHRRAKVKPVGCGKTQKEAMDDLKAEELKLNVMPQGE